MTTLTLPHCVNCGRSFLPATRWQRYCPERHCTDARDAANQAALDQRRTGIVPLGQRVMAAAQALAARGEPITPATVLQQLGSRQIRRSDVAGALTRLTTRGRLVREGEAWRLAGQVRPKTNPENPLTV